MKNLVQDTGKAYIIYENEKRNENLKMRKRKEKYAVGRMPKQESFFYIFCKKRGIRKKIAATKLAAKKLTIS